MQLVTVTDTFRSHFSESAITIGNFDGVHRGHSAIFHNLKNRGAQYGLPTVVVTFNPHPLSVLSPDAAPPLLTTFPQKASLIEQAGIDCLAVIEFNREFSLLSAEAFVRTILCESFGMRHMIIGHDYAFGRDRLGNYATLTDMGTTCGFSLEDLEPFGENGVIFSSSLARRLIGGGNMTEAAKVLGRYYGISGRVTHGRELGTKLGFPTANIETQNELLPPDGVYAVLAIVDGRVLHGACNIGNNPTFSGSHRTVEVFLLDFTGHLYDSVFEICFVDRLRDEKKFPDAESLVTAIHRDIEQTRNILSTVEQSMIKSLSGLAHWSAA